MSNWNISFHDDFYKEFLELSEAVQDEIAKNLEALEFHGPMLGRPFADTLKGSKFKNMKELRFDSDDGVWRLAFAFDPERNAILLVAGDKSGVSQKRFYKSLISKADKRFQQHLDTMEQPK